uniref:Secreted protein n=2 Tax=Lutzomyia longipalpis TaxID=7200 RepID=A0A1B0CR26_LUTLO
MYLGVVISAIFVATRGAVAAPFGGKDFGGGSGGLGGSADLTAGLQAKVGQLTSVAQNAVQTKIQTIGNLKGSFSNQEHVPDYSRQEYEGIPSKGLSIYDNLHAKFGSLTNAQPIVDNIREEDKYGNSGDKFYPVGRKIVDGFEGFSNIINKFFEVPREITRQISRGITDKLNSVGSKIVGLM